MDGCVREGEKVGGRVGEGDNGDNDLSDEHRLLCVRRVYRYHDPHVAGRHHQHRGGSVPM